MKHDFAFISFSIPSSSNAEQPGGMLVSFAQYLSQLFAVSLYVFCGITLQVSFLMLIDHVSFIFNSSSFSLNLIIAICHPPFNDIEMFLIVPIVAAEALISSIVIPIGMSQIAILDRLLC